MHALFLHIHCQSPAHQRRRLGLWICSIGGSVAFFSIVVACRPCRRRRAELLLCLGGSGILTHPLAPPVTSSPVPVEAPRPSFQAIHPSQFYYTLTLRVVHSYSTFVDDAIEANTQFTFYIWTVELTAKCATWWIEVWLTGLNGERWEFT